MLKLTDFIAAIQSAIDSASHMVAKRNLANLGAYFYKDNGGESAAGAKGESAKPSELNDGGGVLRPRMVSMVYPKDSTNGVVEHTVMVPLLSLAPMVNLQPEEINIEIDLEFVEDNGQVVIGFPQAKRSVFGSKTQENKPNAKLTMKINATSRPAGISAVIEGYDKVLRAQIPS